MIDYWLILCQLVPFAQVVLITAKEYLREEEQKGNHVLEMKTSHWLFQQMKIQRLEKRIMLNQKKHGLRLYPRKHVTRVAH